GAESAAEAWAVLDSWSADVILSDIGMPNVDGYAFITRLRSQGCRTPAAALTAYARPADRVKTPASGFQAHLAKPIEPAPLAAGGGKADRAARRLSGRPAPQAVRDTAGATRWLIDPEQSAGGHQSVDWCA